MLVIAPLRVPVTKTKYFVLNLNQYRNAHFYTLNTAKIRYKESLATQLTDVLLVTPIKITYTLFPKNKQRGDLGNALSVHQKFFEDALVEYGCISDDSYKEVVQSTFLFGEVDKDNPRVEIQITQCDSYE